VRHGAALALVAAALAAGCGSSHNRVPDVRFEAFPDALAELRADG
jgi:hypothetical protein